MSLFNMKFSHKDLNSQERGIKRILKKLKQISTQKLKYLILKRSIK